MLLALALLIRLTNRSPVNGSLVMRGGWHRGLPWAGIALVVLTTALEIAIFSGPVVWAETPVAQGTLGVMIQSVAIARHVGAVLLGPWLTGVLTSPRPVPRAPRDSALEPSRPF